MASQMSSFTHSTISTTDGSLLSYYTIGSGPGLIVLHGSMSYGLTQRELGEILASSYTVYLPSRRSHGLSGPYPESVTNIPAVLPVVADGTKDGKPDPETQVVVGDIAMRRTYSQVFATAVVQAELSDLNIILEKTHAEYILGISSGAILLLEALVSLPAMPGLSAIKKAIVFEPPLQFTDINTGIDMSGARRYEDDMEAGDIAGAMVTAMRVVQLGPGFLPRALLK